MNIKYKQGIVAIILLTTMIIASTGCSRNRVRRAMPVEQKMELANNYFDNGRYNRAAELYLDVVFERSTRHTPNAQFKLAESYFNMSRYNEAIFEYKELIRLFPEHGRVNVAYFRIGEAYKNLSLGPHYSQEETIAAIDAFEVFLDRFPFDEKRDEAISYIQDAQYKLIRKKYYNGEIYYRLYDYSAALMYFDEIISLGNRDELDLKSRYYSALIFVERKDRDNARTMLQTMQNHYPTESMTSRVQRLLQRTFN